MKNLLEDCEICDIPPREVCFIWRDVERLLRQGESAWGKYHTLESIYEGLTHGMFHLWVASDEGGPHLVIVTEVIGYPVCNIFRVLWASGSKLDQILPALEFAEIVAARSNCSYIEILGRKAFVKLLKKYEYKTEAFLFSKDISGLKEH